MKQLLFERAIDLDRYPEIASGVITDRREQLGRAALVVADTTPIVRDLILSLCPWDLPEDLTLQAFNIVLDQLLLIN